MSHGVVRRREASSSGSVDDLGRGQVVVVLALGAIVMTSVIVITVYLLKRGTDRLPEQSVRFFLTIVLVRFVYLGRPWARWLTVVLIGGAGVMSFLATTPLVPLGIVYLLAAGLLVSPAASAFLRHQNLRLIQKP